MRRTDFHLTVGVGCPQKLSVTACVTLTDFLHVQSGPPQSEWGQRLLGQSNLSKTPSEAKCGILRQGHE